MMSSRRRPEGRQRPFRCGSLLLLAALFLGGAARPGAAQGPAAVSFRPPITYDQPMPVGLERVIGEPLTAADLDGDGRLDLIVITKDGLSIRYGNGDGTLAPPVDLPLGPGLQEGLVADVNGDGLPDLVFCHFDLGKVVVLLNQGGRQFASPVFYPASDGPVSLTAADFNGDGRPDLAVSCHLDGNLVVLLNRGDGTFLPPVSYGRIDFAGVVLSADFNGDGQVDLAQASLTENVMRIFLGDGKGKFTEKGRYGTDASYAARGVAADFNGDGILDLAIGCQGQYAILFGDGTGGFGPPIRYNYTGTYVLGTGDFDGDGAPDLVAAGGDGAGFSLYLNRQAGNFLPALAIPGPGDKTDSIVVGDFNGDGRPDVVTWNESSPHLAVFLNDTPQPTPAIRSLTLDSASLIGGCQSATGTVTLTAPAPVQGAIGGVVVVLASSSPAVAVPAEILIPQGALQAHFPVVTTVTAALQWASISASFSSSAKRAALVVRPMGPPQLTISPGQVIGGQTAAGQVTIACPAGPGGLAITLSSSSPLVSVPAAVTVPPGAATAAFPIGTDPVATAATATISAGPPGAAATASLQLLPPLPPQPPVPPTAPPGLTLTLFPNPVPGGLLALGQVILTQPVGAAGATVSLYSSNPAAAVVPAAVTVLPGANSVTFPIVTFPVAAPASVLISASGAFGAATAALQVVPLSFLVPPAPPAANLLVNGSFEEPHVPNGNAIGGVSGNGLPGWRITRGTVDVISGYWQPAPDGGSQSIDLVGTPGAATIEQTIPTVPGRNYLFSGWLSHNWMIGEGRADVSLNGAFFVELYHNTPNADRDMHWVPFSYRFQAAAAATTLAIADVTGADNAHGTALDGLSVTLAPNQNPPIVSAAAPAAPTGLTVTAVNANRVSLAWIDNSDNETAFAIWRRDSSGTWSRVGVVPPNTTTFTDTGLTPGSTYTYRVRAINNVGASGWSNEVTVTTLP